MKKEGILTNITEGGGIEMTILRLTGKIECSVERTGRPCLKTDCVMFHKWRFVHNIKERSLFGDSRCSTCNHFKGINQYVRRKDGIT